MMSLIISPSLSKHLLHVLPTLALKMLESLDGKRIVF